MRTDFPIHMYFVSMLFSIGLTRKIKFRAVLIINPIMTSYYVTKKGILSYAPEIENPPAHTSHHPVPPSPHKGLSRMLWGRLLEMSISIDRLFGCGNISNTIDPCNSSSMLLVHNFPTSSFLLAYTNILPPYNPLKTNGRRHNGV